MASGVKLRGGKIVYQISKVKARGDGITSHLLRSISGIMPRVDIEHISLVEEEGKCPSEVP